MWKRAKDKVINFLPVPSKTERKDEEKTFKDYHRSFQRTIAESLAVSIGGLMLSNALNIVAVRMQNVDYPNNRSFLRAVKDLVVVDKHRMFYKGLAPITLACANLYCITDLMHMFKRTDIPQSHYVWPFVYVAGMLLVHPFYLLGMRV